jgi:GH15 family glucan-1,4-alpha-glucosidase
MEMSESIASYGLIGDLQTCALVGDKGNIDWLCWPELDSQACFARLLGEEKHGYWRIAPSGWKTTTRRYLAGTLVLESTYTQTLGARVTVTDFMPMGKGSSAVVRIVRGVKGSVRMQMCLATRFDYGNAQPLLLQESEDCWSAVTGPHRLIMRTNVAVSLKAGDLVADWKIKAGETCTFVLQHSNSFLDEPPAPLDAEAELEKTVQHWQAWSARNQYTGPYKQAVERSLLTLKALSYAASGGFVAAPTTSLPERPGGIRNWDYRFCWLRDTELSLTGMQQCGYKDDAKAWLDWLARSVQGRPRDMKILYGISGKREHSEWQASWLPGYAGSKPVHIGNKASGQLQLDTFGEVMDALYHARRHGLYPHADRSGESLELPLLAHLEKVWDEPDAGLWEFRGAMQQFVHSKVMAWVAFDRGLRIAKEFDMKAPVERWTKLRDHIHDQVCKKGFHKGLNSFAQAYGSRNMDAALLRIPLVGFLPADDPRIVGTVRCVEKHLLRKGLLLRYDTAKVKDGLPAGEGAFLACNFWLVDVYVLQGRHDEARALFEKLLGLSNDLGLLSEEYDAKHGLIGNFPQAFSHIGLLHSALSIEAKVPAKMRGLF